MAQIASRDVQGDVQDELRERLRQCIVECKELRDACEDLALARESHAIISQLLCSPELGDDLHEHYESYGNDDLHEWGIVDSLDAICRHIHEVGFERVDVEDLIDQIGSLRAKVGILQSRRALEHAMSN